jgi:hypothetical protein
MEQIQMITAIMKASIPKMMKIWEVSPLAGRGRDEKLQMYIRRAEAGR